MTNRFPLWLIPLCLVPLAAGISGHDLWTPDEPREAEIAREMAEGGSLLVPTLAGEPFVEKPPLYYWVSALALKTLGKIAGPTAAARAVSAAASALTLLFLYLAAANALGTPSARSAALVLATAYGFFYASHWIIMDSLLMLFISGAVLLLHQGLERERPVFFAAAGLSAGLAFLTKGPIALVLVALPWGVLLFLRRSALRRHPIAAFIGLLLLLSPGLAWMAAFRSQGGPELWREWLLQNQFGRFAGKAGGHYQGPFYYFQALPYVLLPWTAAFIGWIVHRKMRGIPEEGPARRLLIAAAAWAVGGFILLSIPGTKRETYLFPLLPAFALLVARALEEPLSWVRWSLRAVCLLLILVLAAFAFLTPVWTREGTTVALAIKPAALAGAAAAILSYLRLKRDSLAQTAAVAACFYLTAAVAGFPLIDRYKSYGPAVREIAEAIPPEARGKACLFRSDETYLAMFPYYCGLYLEDVREAERLQGILEGKDESFSLVIASGRNFPPPDVVPPPFRIVREVTMGKRRSLLLITGNK